MNNLKNIIIVVVALSFSSSPWRIPNLRIIRNLNKSLLMPFLFLFNFQVPFSMLIDSPASLYFRKIIQSTKKMKNVENHHENNKTQTDWLTEWKPMVQNFSILYGFNEIDIRSHSHHSKHLPFVQWQPVLFLVYFLIQWIQSYSVLCRTRCRFWCVCVSKKKLKIKLKSLYLVCLLCLTVNRKRKIEMRVKIKEKKWIKFTRNFHKFKFAISTRKMRPCNRKKVKKGKKKQ